VFVQIEVGGCMFCFTGGTTGQWSMFVRFLSLLFFCGSIRGVSSWKDCVLGARNYWKLIDEIHMVTGSLLIPFGQTRLHYRHEGHILHILQGDPSRKPISQDILTHDVLKLSAGRIFKWLVVVFDTHFWQLQTIAIIEHPKWHVCVWLSVFVTLSWST